MEVMLNGGGCVWVCLCLLVRMGCPRVSEPGRGSWICVPLSAWRPHARFLVCEVEEKRAGARKPVGLGSPLGTQGSMPGLLSEESPRGSAGTPVLPDLLALRSLLGSREALKQP